MSLRFGVTLQIWKVTRTVGDLRDTCSFVFSASEYSIHCTDFFFLKVIHRNIVCVASSKLLFTSPRLVFNKGVVINCTDFLFLKVIHRNIVCVAASKLLFTSPRLVFNKEGVVTSFPSSSPPPSSYWDKPYQNKTQYYKLMSMDILSYVLICWSPKTRTLLYVIIMYTIWELPCSVIRK